MPPIGESLREARLRQGTDIAEVEQATKIRAKYLRALEAEEFDRLPGSTFVRQFLRTYAEYLGLDSRLLVDEYRAHHEAPGMEEEQNMAPPPAARPGGREGRRRPQLGGPGPVTIAVAAAVLLLGLIILIGLIAGDDPADTNDPAATTDPPAEEEPREEREDRQASEEPPDDVRLTVTPAAETYVCVENGDGEELFESTISAPETFRDEVLLVNLGNTQVELEVNGEGFPVEEGANPVGFEFTPEGGEELPEGERPCA